MGHTHNFPYSLLSIINYTPNCTCSNYQEWNIKTKLLIGFPRYKSNYGLWHLIVLEVWLMGLGGPEVKSIRPQTPAKTSTINILLAVSFDSAGEISSTCRCYPVPTQWLIDRCWRLSSITWGKTPPFWVCLRVKGQALSRVDSFAVSMADWAGIALHGSEVRVWP